MIWERVRGHRAQVEMFRRSIGRGRLSHAYLFIGPDGIGKRLFARTLAQCLFCTRFENAELDACGKCMNCRQMQARTHPDYLTIERQEGKSGLPIEAFVGIRERRGQEGLCHDIALRPMTAERRIAVIDDAHLMGNDAANSFLKTLEEPPDYAVFFLIAPAADAFLPTIRSRCQQVRFAALPDEDIASLLVEQGETEDPAEAKVIAELSDGSLTTAAQLLDPNLRALRESLYEELANDRYDSVKAAKAILDRLDGLGGDSHKQRQNAGWALRFCQEFYRRTLRALAGDCDAEPIAAVRRFASRFDASNADDLDRVGELFDRVAASERQIDQKAGIPLCFEALFEDLGRIARPVAQR